MEMWLYSNAVSQLNSVGSESAQFFDRSEWKDGASGRTERVEGRSEWKQHVRRVSSESGHWHVMRQRLPVHVGI